MLKKTKKTERSTAGLCDVLFEELDMLRNGESDAKRATSIAKLTTTIIHTKKLEMEAARLLHGIANIDSVFDSEGLRLGRD